ncbi:nitrite reductase/ring-hydroxylating ferredoxin subunit [Prauserella shujinwangii]|uniref:Cytochrome bc1 complex Rieske iron-sulfur subunit n=1 Tax=Prauserella shujinwangii TaxID=1453103 RepID=A0A2T0LRH1_9PSEU|nr:Rieske (2Fe-2S) protein [Prauserella shujinwangii]PRX46096.1 nitrite reductase/ring-hydroxylating ferredoxin subunit [Prauserella shujinwangii]
MTAQSHTRRTVLTTGAAIAGAAVGGVTLAACGDSGTGSDPAASGGDAGGASPAPPSGQALASVSEVPVGEAKSVTTPDGAEAIVSRQDESTVAGFSAVCTHQGCTVQPEGTELKCPCHGSLFDAFTGEVKNGPATEPLPPINVKIENGRIVTA